MTAKSGSRRKQRSGLVSNDELQKDSEIREDFQRRIAENLNGLTANDRRVADFILEEFPQIAFATAQEIADRVGVSKAAVVRLATRLGYFGFTELKTALRQHVNSQLQSPLQLLQEHERNLKGGAAALVAHRTQKVVDNIAATNAALSSNRIEKAARTLARADRVIVAGERKSWGLAVYCARLFRMLRPRVEMWPGPAHPLPEAALDLSRKDAMIALSFRRYSVDILNLAGDAKEQGTWVLAVTDNPLSPAVNVASEVIVCSCEDVSMVDSMIVPVFVLETLAALLGRELGRAVQERLRRGEDLANRAKIYPSTRRT